MNRILQKTNLISLLLVTSLGAQVVTVQGVLRDNNNAAVSDGTYTMIFEIFDSQSGGTSLWSTVDEDVTVINGVYSLGLNIGTTLQSSGSELWLEVTVNGDTMNERVRLHISPYEQMIIEGQSNVFPGSGNVGIGTTSPDSPLSVVGDVSSTGTVSASAFQGDGSALTGIDPSNIDAGDVNFNNITATGNVAIGTTNSDSPLSVEGNIATSNITIANRITFTNEGYWSRFSLIHPAAGSSPRSYWYGQDIEGTAKDFSINIEDLNSNTVISFSSGDGGSVLAGKKLKVSKHGSWLNSTGESIKVGELILGHDTWGPAIWSENPDGNYSDYMHLHFGTPNFDGNSTVDYESDMMISGFSGNVGIGTTTPNAKLHVAGHIRTEWFTDDDSPGYYMDPHQTTVLNLFYASNVTASRTLVSDNNDRLQYSNVENIDPGILDKFSALQPVSFTSYLHGNESSSFGFRKENMRNISPELINTLNFDPNGKALDESIEGLDIYSLVVQSVGAINELRSEKDAEIEKLNKTIEKLIERIEELDNK